MGRKERVRAAARKLAERATQSNNDLAFEIGRGVELTTREILPVIKSGAAYWQGPLQYVCEQMAPRVCHEHGVALEQADDVAGYLLAGMNEYIVSLAGAFDPEHFLAWTATMGARAGGDDVG